MNQTATPMTDAIFNIGPNDSDDTIRRVRRLERDRAELIAALAETEAALRGASLDLSRLNALLDEWTKGQGGNNRPRYASEHYEFKANEARATLARVRP